MLLSLNFNWSRILNLRVYSRLWCIIHPLSNKNFVFLTKEVRSLAFSFVINPMAFKVISASLCEHPIPASVAHIPHSLVNISVGVYHSPFAMRQIIHPHAIITIARLVKHSTSSLLWIILPISSILPPQLILSISYPVCSLPMPFVLIPASLILISVWIVLYSKPLFLIVFPVTYVFMRIAPFVRFRRAILIERLFLYVRRSTLTQ